MAFLRNPVVYVPDLANGRPIVDGRVYALVAGTVPPMHDSAIDPADLLTVTYKNEAGNIVEHPQPLYTSKGGCLFGNYPDSAVQYMIYPQEYVYAVYNRIGQLEYSGSTNASDYVETDALAATGSTVLVGGIEAGKAGTYLKRVFVEQYGAVGNGSTDDAAAFLVMHTALGYIMLAPKKSYFVSFLPNLATLIIIGNNATINYNTLLVDRTFTLLDIQDVNFDAQNSNLTRCIRVRKNSFIKFRNLNGYNINSLTFVRMLDISTENVSIDIQDCYCQNLVSVEDGIIGNNNGATRFIYVGDEDATPLVSPSYGMIANIRGNILLPKEDGDMIHIQSSDSKIFNIAIDNIFGYKVAKRVVKVQANGVYVSNVTADAKDNPVAMYSIVSHYGQYGSVSNVSGSGKLEHGVDTQYENTPFTHINVTNTGTAVSQGAAFKGSGGMSGTDIFGYGFEHVVGNYNSLVTNANTSVKNVSGTATGAPVFVRASVVSGSVYLDGIRVLTSAAARLVQVTRTSSNSFTTVDVNDVVGSCGLFTAVDITGAATSKAKNIDITQTVSGIPLTVNAGEAYCEDIVGRGASTDAVFLNATTKAVVTRARGGTSAQVLTSGCNNSIVNNAICAAGVPASRNTGTASTNTQNVGTLTFV